MNTLIDPVVRAYLAFNSPLKTLRGNIILGAIVAVMLVFAALGWRDVLSTRSLILFAWLIYPAIGSILGYLVLAFLDRKRRVRLFHAVAILGVIFLTGPIAAFLTDRSPAPKITVGFVEEFVKVIPLLLYVAFIPNLIRTRKDGLIYGALGGMGFNIVEIPAYIVTGSQKAPLLDTLLLHSTRLGVWGLGSHILWSAFVGLGIGMSLESDQRGWRRWRPAIVAYALAALSHSAFDNGFSLIGIAGAAAILALIQGMPIDAAFEQISAGKAGEIGFLRTSIVFAPYIYQSIFIAIMLFQIVKSFAQEHALTVAQLSTESDAIVDDAELDRLKAERLFFMRRYRQYPRQIGRNIVYYQNLLAMQKHAALQEGLPDDQQVHVLRQAIRSLRAAAVARHSRQRALAK